MKNQESTNNCNNNSKLFQVCPALPKSEIILGEEWKPLALEGYSDYFLISNHGRIYNKQRRKLQPLTPNTKNYLVTDLTINGKNRKKIRVHRYVLLTFLPRKDAQKLETNHKDADKSNNKLSNLEWATPQENRSHAVRLGLYKNPRRFTDEEVIYIRQSKKTNIKLAKEFNTYAEKISAIKRGLTYQKVQETV